MGGQNSKLGTKRCWMHEKSKPSFEKVGVQQLVCTTGIGEPSSNVHAPYVTFDVFLNHRGVDTKAKFVRYLEEELNRVGLRPFLDAKSLVKGENASKSMDEALGEAQVHVAVISKRYVESKWCLNELVAMLKSGKPVIPVFYEVEPSDLRLALRPSAPAFKKHMRKGREYEVKEWANALEEVANIMGFRSANFEGDEVKLKNKIVKEIQRRMPTNELLRIGEYEVGLESSLHACIEEFEKMGATTGILSIVGMGGVGKTTLSTNVFNWYATKKTFPRMTFLNDIRSAALCLQGGYRLVEMQKQLLWDLLRVPKDDYKQDYWFWFQRLSTQSPVFIVLDNIDHKSQFEQLIPDVRLLASGSRIIITSRALGVVSLKDGRLKQYEYPMKCLESCNALKLFNWHAFGGENASEEFKGYVHDIVKACSGLPLALKVIGSTLSNKKSSQDEEDIWPEAVQALKQCSDILEVLKWSYHSLQLDEEKLMFLDIAWFQDGIERRSALDMWEACKYCGSCIGFRTPKTSLRNLIDRCLVEDSSGHLAMHDMLREMAQDATRNQSRDPLERSHHWDVHIAENMLERNQMQVANQIRGLTLGGSTNTFAAERFGTMERLHFLKLDGCTVHGDFTLFPKDLRMLQWRQMPLMQLPSELNLSRLTTLDLSWSDKMACLWTNSNFPMQNCRNLRTLNIGNCKSITTLPKTIGFCSDLRSLKCDGCSSLTSLPQEISGLSRLEVLTLGSCENLEALPNSIGELKQLCDMEIFDCPKLNALPSSIVELLQLKLLTLGDVRGKLQLLPDKFGQLNALEYLEVRSHALKELPSSFGGLMNLTNLDIEGGQHMEGLPESFCDLLNMETCYLSSCGLRCLPKEFGRLSNLYHLNLYRLENLEHLPMNLGCLSNLVSLNIGECDKLKELPSSLTVLHKLKSLGLIQNLALTSLPEDFGRLSNLEMLWLNDCKSLEQLPASIVELQNLYMLDISGSGVKCLPENFERLSNLTDLDLCNCPNLPKHLVGRGFCTHKSSM